MTPVQAGFKEPFDYNAYAETFFPTAERLLKEADAAKAEGNIEAARGLYL